MAVADRPRSLRGVGVALLAAVFTIVLGALLTIVAGGGQRELAARVDENAARARERGELIATQLARHRYVSDCLLFTEAFDPAPGVGRDVEDLLICLDEAEVIEFDDVDRLGDILEANLKERGIA